MLPDAQQSPYLEFHEILKRLRSHVEAPDADLAAMQSALGDAQRMFQQDILGAGLEEVEGAIAARIQSIHTEMNKQLRLMGMDVMFLQTARQSATAQARREQVGDRLNILTSYCEALLGGAMQDAEDPRGSGNPS